MVLEVEHGWAVALTTRAEQVQIFILTAFPGRYRTLGAAEHDLAARAENESTNKGVVP